MIAKAKGNPITSIGCPLGLIKWVTPAAIKATSEDQRACLVADFKSGFWVRI
ncbi:hypothetical protein CK203_071846 [Vitis vinifera]|uniref:Uncharacterized protein n=1 Tax=Vitis vinifera TaxID=29760 RepID=A0A438F3R5_VITVI|nr:hypothetical protein CK203_071846 [Vitis vinifera]